MLSRSAFLRDHCHDLEEFMDSENPLPISLLGQFGGVIANNFETPAPSEWAALAVMIEQGLTSDDADVSTAVATGLYISRGNDPSCRGHRQPMAED